MIFQISVLTISRFAALSGCRVPRDAARGGLRASACEFPLRLVGAHDENQAGL